MLVKTKSQVERTEVKQNEQLKILLAAELNEITEGLDRANAMKVRLYGGLTAEVVITHIQPTVVQEAVRNGFFDPSRAQKALRLVRNHAHL